MLCPHVQWTGGSLIALYVLIDDYMKFLPWVLFLCHSTGFWYICFYLAAQCVEEILQISRKKRLLDRVRIGLHCKLAHKRLLDSNWKLKTCLLQETLSYFVILVEETEVEWNVIPQNASRLHTNIHNMLCNLTRESAFMPLHVHFFTEVLFSWEKSSTEQVQSP